MRDAAGEPTGILKDNATDLITRARAAGHARRDDGRRRGRRLQHAASVGVTTVQDMTASADRAARLSAASRAGRAARPHHLASRTTASTASIAAGVTTGFGDDWLRIGGIKLFADGSMGSGTAAFFAPYADDPSTSGLLIQSPEALREDGVRRRRRGLPGRSCTRSAIAPTPSCSTSSRSCSRSAAHAIGARASSTRRSCATPTSCVSRRPASSRRFSRATASTTCAGPRSGSAATRSKIAYDFKSFVDAGARIAFGTDWFVEPMNPMLGLYAAVTRQFPDGTPPGGWFPEERHHASIRPSSSTRSARPMPSSPRRGKGRLQPGYLADFVVLSKPIFDIAAAGDPDDDPGHDRRRRPHRLRGGSEPSSTLGTSHFPLST